MSNDPLLLLRHKRHEQRPKSEVPAAELRDYLDAESTLLQMCLPGSANSAAIDFESNLRSEPARSLPEVAIRNAAMRYRTLIEQIPAVTFMAALDGNSNELHVSPQIEAMLGFSQKEWLEDPVLWYTCLHPDDRERWHTEFAMTCALGQPFSPSTDSDAEMGGSSGSMERLRSSATTPACLCSSTASRLISRNTKRPRKRSAGRKTCWNSGSKSEPPS